MSRRHEIDALRGLMLILMTLTHLPTRFSESTGEPFGFVSAAEGFVFLSAFMVGWIYVGRARKNGIPAMRRTVWRRAFMLYACQVGLLLFLLTVVVPIGAAKGQPAIINLVSFFNSEHLTALLSGLVLLYDPPLLDILPLYILFMLTTPAVLTLSLRRGWAPILSVSFGLWVLAQFGVGQAILPDHRKRHALRHAVCRDRAPFRYSPGNSSGSSACGWARPRQRAASET